MSEPNRLEEAWADIGRQIGTALTNLGLITAGQGAMGWMLQDEPEKARGALRGVTADQRARIAAAARDLAAMAEKAV